MRLTFYSIFTCALLFTVVGCTSVFDDVRATWHYATEKVSDAELSPADIQQFPYTALYIRRTNEPRALIVLGYIDGQDANASYSWISQQRETLVTRHGRVIRTSSLQPELVYITNLEQDPLLCIQQAMQSSISLNSCSMNWSHQRDMENVSQQRFSIKTESVFFIEDLEALTLPGGRNVDALHIREQINFADSKAGRKQTFYNDYWLESDGHVVKSHQHLAPELTFMIEQVKWVGRDEN